MIEILFIFCALLLYALGAVVYTIFAIYKKFVYFKRENIQGVLRFNVFNFPCFLGWSTVYTGQGYLQGMGCNIKICKLEIGHFSCILDYKFDVESEWLESLKKKLQ